MKTISFAIPCYNSEEYMDTCIKTLLACDGGVEDCEILIVDDGSEQDNTARKADEWEAAYPSIIRAIHKENGGHGSAVNAGLDAATGFYFKVVDSDDWLDAQSMAPVMDYVRKQTNILHPTDLIIGNYVYEKVFEGTRSVMRYTNVFPKDREFSWDETKRFRPSQYLLMHSVFYRTQLLKDIGLRLPEHCFYVDNIFVYVPLPAVRTIRYFDADIYRYFIGREGQSVNEDVMVSRIDQQLRVTRIMIDAIDPLCDVSEKQLAQYMENYLSMMMCICSVFLRLSGSSHDENKRRDIWDYLRTKRPALYPRIRRNIVNLATNIPTSLGKSLGIGGYRLAQRIFKFN